MKSYTDIYEEYHKNVYLYAEKEYSWYKQADNLKDAIRKAFLSEDEQGKVHPHQRRVGRQRLALAADIALKHLDTQCVIDFDNFNSIYQFVQDVRNKVEGFGELANYDVALRITKYLGFELQEVYLHAGVTIGFRALGLNVKERDIIPVEEFPEPFKQLSGDHLENLLCIYKEVLADSSVEFPKTCICPKTNSSCINKNGRVC
ncbi:hypothetical protein CDG76_10445 [Nostoc sp. 'Peltigera membranacea cyanobiont' 210A]|uniref:hypothetical protein n=1 Tax=Nostoc sp. 'Peltigera membranacea cyanobiont' 210A TaxID=2014529 RepID=UPI000B951F9A|nr:hypothetical protein [Nostoc sp. 'Peltigera membranacea cyanobiont' 210A]OYD95385.1 hypothetical protein CDG76_10445 [Nostoc sp. 'Peltigera membranacea cyanobiont' 210A]